MGGKGGGKGSTAALGMWASGDEELWGLQLYNGGLQNLGCRGVGILGAWAFW